MTAQAPPLWPSNDSRALILAPTGRDGALACELLSRHGFDCRSTRTLEELCDAIDDGAGVVMVAEEALVGGDTSRLSERFAHQPAWSDLQLVLLTRDNLDHATVGHSLEGLTNITVLERPVRIASMVSVVETALRSRLRQYELRDLLAQLAELDRKKDEFLAMLGHELRNPLATIVTAISLLEHGGARSLERVLPAMRRQTTNLERIVDDLLEVSRVLTGKIELTREPVDLNEIGRAGARSIASTAAAHDLTVDCELADEALVVDGDPARLDQVLINLLTNAVKYTPSGGRITLRLDRRDGAAILSVTDSGVGLEPQVLESIFEPFTQVDASIDRSEGGLGLGLPLVARLVELHGGTVHATSEGLGRGSTFTVRLPLHDGTAPAARSSDPIAGAVNGRRRVMVVDDNAELREMIAMLLEGWGHDVECYEDGLAALERIRHCPPDVALVDIGMPRMDGYELARRIRADPKGRDLRLVAVTGYGQSTDRKRALSVGFDEHLVKPVDAGRLARLLDEG